jgi:hypothetical protein
VSGLPAPWRCANAPRRARRAAQRPHSSTHYWMLMFRSGARARVPRQQRGAQRVIRA